MSNKTIKTTKMRTMPSLKQINKRLNKTEHAVLTYQEDLLNPCAACHSTNIKILTTLNCLQDVSAIQSNDYVLCKCQDCGTSSAKIYADQPQQSFATLLYRAIEAWNNSNHTPPKKFDKGPVPKSFKMR